MKAPQELYYLAGIHPLIGDALAWAYAAHGDVSMATAMREMASYGRNRDKPVNILEFRKGD